VIRRVGARIALLASMLWFTVRTSLSEPPSESPEGESSGRPHPVSPEGRLRSQRRKRVALQVAGVAVILVGVLAFFVSRVQ